MSTQKTENDVLDFITFLRKYFPNYTIDGNNHSLITKLTYWAARDKKFEDAKIGQYLDKGIMLMGPVGSGKTDLFNILQTYINRYLRNAYRFSYNVVWQFTSEFNQKGYESLKDQEIGNRYYDELCLSDSRNKIPMKEHAMHYGQKIIIGEEIIMLRYNCFKREGFQTHFSTNVDPDDLREIYGERAYSRLTEMCNIMLLDGIDRRTSGRPNIYRNNNNPAPPPPKQISMDAEIEGKKVIEHAYKQFLGEEPATDTMNFALLYNTMVGFKVSVCTDDEMRLLIEEITGSYNPDTILFRGTIAEKEAHKNTKIWEMSRKMAVNLFFQKMKDGNAKSIFGIVDVTQQMNEIEQSTINANK